MVKVFITFGFYLERAGMLLHIVNREEVSEKDLAEIANEYAYSRAYEMAEGWVGSSGFCEDEDGEPLEDYHEELEPQLEYSAELYDPEEHDGWKMGGCDEHDILVVTL